MRLHVTFQPKVRHDCGDQGTALQAAILGPAGGQQRHQLIAIGHAAKLIKEVANLRVVGPMLVNMQKPVQIVPMNSSAGDIVTLGVLASTGVVC
jgi:malate dehydrogenase (oxaloacetate-decarboxylating)(NADP+)